MIRPGGNNGGTASYGLATSKTTSMCMYSTCTYTAVHAQTSRCMHEVNASITTEHIESYTVAVPP